MLMKIIAYVMWYDNALFGKTTYKYIKIYVKTKNDITNIQVILLLQIIAICIDNFKILCSPNIIHKLVNRISCDFVLDLHIPAQ